MLFDLTNLDKEKIKLGYKYKVISNMVNYRPVYFKEKTSAELHGNQLSEQWEPINVYVLVIKLEEN